MSSFPAWYTLLLVIPALLVGFTVHEYMHARAADKLGDPTARLAGRITLNPIKHLDPIGTLVLIVTSIQFGAGFGWAKPVPINPNRFNNPRWDSVIVSLAGPAANLGAAVVFAFFFKWFGPASLTGGFSDFFWAVIFQIVLINLVLMFFNLIPIPPLDGSKVLQLFLPSRYLSTWYRFEQYGIVVLIAVLLLVPQLVWEPIRFGMGLILGAIGV